MTATRNAKDLAEALVRRGRVKDHLSRKSPWIKTTSMADLEKALEKEPTIIITSASSQRLIQTEAIPERVHAYLSGINAYRESQERHVPLVLIAKHYEQNGETGQQNLGELVARYQPDITMVELGIAHTPDYRFLLDEMSKIFATPEMFAESPRIATSVQRKHRMKSRLPPALQKPEFYDSGNIVSRGKALLTSASEYLGI